MAKTQKMDDWGRVHRAPAEYPVWIPNMTTEEFREALERLGVTQLWLAAHLGVDRGQVSRWARRTVPGWMPFLLMVLAWVREHENRPLIDVFPTPGEVGMKRQLSERQKAEEGETTA